MSVKPLRIATRKSALALWQANYVKARLEYFHPGLGVELLPMTSRGDKILDVSLSKIGGKGLFVKELEHALLNNEADIAVHSMKDVPMAFPEGLGLPVICERQDPRDAFVSNRYTTVDELPQGARVGTSSLRRQCQLLATRSDLQMVFLRGNVNTRLSKLDAEEYDAIILASAGLLRLDMSERIKAFIAPEDCLPAGGQGAVGIECRVDDKATIELLTPLHHLQTAECVFTERAMNRRLHGGCQVPIGCYAVHRDSNQLWLRGLVGSPDGQQIIAKEHQGSPEDAEAIGAAVADALLDAGADQILQAVCRDDHSV